MEQRVQSTAVGIIRLGVGASLVVAPGWAGRIWVGPGADGPGSKVFARAVGARDVALGIKILKALQDGEAAGPWIRSGFVADMADAAATAIAFKHLTPWRRLAMPAIALTVGALGYVASAVSSEE